MYRTWTLLASLAISVVGTTACSSSSSGAPVGGDESTGTPVSFANDVMPIFATTCTNFTPCHGSQATQGSMPLENLDLGACTTSPDCSSPGPNTTASITAAYNNLVGVPSEEDPQMNLVTKGDTANSYLFHKLNGTQGTLAAACAAATPQPVCVTFCTVANPCGDYMPYTNAAAFATTNPTQFQTIADWISQGALNN